MPKTTVVIPNYNGIKYLDACLASLYKGTLIPKVILVDNGSWDGSRELAEERYPAVKVITFSENKGFSCAVNAGIRESDTEYVLLLNNDTVADASMVEELERSLDQCSDAFSAAAKMVDLNAPDKLDGAGDFYCALGWAFARGKDKPVDAYDKPGRIFSACAGAAIYRRNLFERVGLFDEGHFAYLEDVDLGYRANIYGFQNLYEPKAVVYHAGSGFSGSRHNEFKVSLSSRNSVYLVYKNMPILQLLINLPFLIVGYAVKFLFFCIKGLGGVYFKGLMDGVKLSLSIDGRRNKVRFSGKNIKSYLWVQGQLWGSLIRLICSIFR